jgi:hypothetical protein
LRVHGITNDYLDALAGGKSPSSNLHVDAALVSELAEQLHAFHWHLEFPVVFERGGFDVMLGNPPWEHVELKEKEWFALRVPSISEAAGAKRKRLIQDLEVSDPLIFEEFQAARRRQTGLAHFVATSGLFPLTAHGRINFYPLFAELFRKYLKERGRMGIIVPTGIATDDSTKYYFQELVLTSSLVSLYDFENKGIFVGVDDRFKFALLTAGSGAQPIAPEARFAFFCHSVDDLADPERTFVLTPEDILLLNPNTKNCPVFRSRRDAEITKRIYRLHPVLIDESDPAAPSNPWGIRFKQGLFNMTTDSHLFRTREVLIDAGYTLEGNVFKRPGAEDMLPLYEGKMFNLFNDRWAHVESDAPVGTGPDDVVMPRYWVPVGEVQKASKEGEVILTLVRKITNATNWRTFVSCLAPKGGFGDSVLLMSFSELSLYTGVIWSALSSSLAFDFLCRNKLGGSNITFALIKQLPFPVYDPQIIHYKIAMDAAASMWRGSRAMNEMIARYLPSEIEKLPKHPVDLTAARFEAASFKLFGYSLDEVEHVMDTFPIVRKKDEAEHGEYRTKRLILEAFSSL